MPNKFVPRLHVCSRLCAHKSFVLTKEQAHYLRVVLRLHKDETVFVFNDQQGQYAARIVSLFPSKGALYVLQKTRDAEKIYPVTLLCAPIARDRLRFVIEKGTELGTTCFQMVSTQNTNASISFRKTREHALYATQQCDRLSVPKVEPIKPLMDVLNKWPRSTPLIYCTERGIDGFRIEAIDNRVKGLPLSILVGPEGGFCKEEHTYIMQQPYTLATKLGRHVLRAETASIAALSILQAMAGTWHKEA